MMKEVIGDLNVAGSKIFADNLFVSVEMFRWCKVNNVNLCGTTRRSWGFPKVLLDTFCEMDVKY